MCYVLRIASDLSHPKNSEPQRDSGMQKGEAMGEHKLRRNKITLLFPQPSHHSKGHKP